MFSFYVFALHRQTELKNPPNGGKMQTINEEEKQKYPKSKLKCHRETRIQIPKKKKLERLQLCACMWFMKIFAIWSKDYE